MTPDPFFCGDTRTQTGETTPNPFFCGGARGVWRGRGGRLDMEAWWWLRGNPSARVSAADASRTKLMALGVFPARRVSGGGQHEPPVRSMKRRVRNARKPVAFRSYPVAPTVAEVALLRPALPSLPMIPSMRRKVLKIPDTAAAIYI